MLVNLIYASKSVLVTDSDACNDILIGSRRRNALFGLTGILVFDQKYFLQVVEGHQTAVNQLLKNLMADSRHHSLTLTHFGAIEKRMFPDWSMGAVLADDVHRVAFLEYGTTGVFDPFEMTEKTALGTLLKLRNLAQVRLAA